MRNRVEGSPGIRRSRSQGALTSVASRARTRAGETANTLRSTSAHGRLMLTVRGGLAEFERDLIRTRTGEGRKRAIARGVKMGRPPKMTPHQIKEALRRRDAGEPHRDIARSYNVSHSTSFAAWRMRAAARIPDKICYQEKNWGVGAGSLGGALRASVRVAKIAFASHSQLSSSRLA